MNPEEQKLAEKFKGLHKNRLNQYNPREVAFACHWALECERQGLLHHLLTTACERGDPGAFRNFAIVGYSRKPIGDLTDRDEAIAATVIQWLGSNIGMCFLAETLKDLGYELRKLP